jgi:hypothetical protein
MSLPPPNGRSYRYVAPTTERAELSLCRSHQDTYGRRTKLAGGTYMR